MNRFRHPVPAVVCLTLCLFSCHSSGISVTHDRGYRDRVVLPVQSYLTSPALNPENPYESAGILTAALIENRKSAIAASPRGSASPREITLALFQQPAPWTGTCICCCPENCPCDDINDLIFGLGKYAPLALTVLETAGSELTFDDARRKSHGILQASEQVQFDLFVDRLQSTVDHYVGGDISSAEMVSQIKQIEVDLRKVGGRVATLFLPATSIARHTEFELRTSCDPGTLAITGNDVACVAATTAGALVAGLVGLALGGPTGAVVLAQVGVSVAAGAACVVALET